MKHYVIDVANIDAFTFEHVKLDGSYCKRLEFKYQSEKFLNTFDVFIERGFHYKPNIRIESINGDFLFDAKPDYLNFDSDGCVARFYYADSSCLTITFEFDNAIEGTYFTVSMEEC